MKNRRTQIFGTKSEKQANKFQVKGGYPLLVEELVLRDWEEESDENSSNANLRFTAKIRDANFDKLKTWQICNHIRGITQLSLKSFLSRNIRSVVWRSFVNFERVVPISFCVPTEHPFAEFVVLFDHVEVSLKVQKQILQRG